MGSRNLLTGLLLAAATLGWRGSAFAQPSTTYPPACTSVPAAKSEEAHAFYNAGRAFYDEGNYDSAIAQFREAYKRDCSKHDLLVIISRSYELKGDKPEAVRALEVFLERAKDSPEAGTHRTRIDNLKKQIAAQPPQVAPSSPAVTPVSAAPHTEKVREHTVPPWILVGAGGAAMAVGTVVVLTTPSLPAGCDTKTASCAPGPATETPEQYRARQQQAGYSQDQPVVGFVTLGAGAALAAGGLLWHFLEPTGPVRPTTGSRPSVRPAVSPGYAGMVLGGSF